MSLLEYKEFEINPRQFLEEIIVSSYNKSQLWSVKVSTASIFFCLTILQQNSTSCQTQCKCAILSSTQSIVTILVKALLVFWHPATYSGSIKTQLAVNSVSVWVPIYFPPNMNATPAPLSSGLQAFLYHRSQQSLVLSQDPMWFSV
jgi:hypothetical protein